MIALTPRHTEQVLTKRSARRRDYFAGPLRWCHAATATGRAGALVGRQSSPLPNVWLGVSTERQKEADKRIPDLVVTPTAVRFLSTQPLLGSIDLRSIKGRLPWMMERYSKTHAGFEFDGRTHDAMPRSAG